MRGQVSCSQRNCIKRNCIKKNCIKNYIKKGSCVGKRLLFLLVTLFVIVLGTLFFGKSFSSARAESNDVRSFYKYHKSIEIEYGDSLWSIAQEYKLDDMDTQDYIKDLMKINGLTSEDIHAGHYLVVICYDTELH